MRSALLAPVRPSSAEIVFVGCQKQVPGALSWPARAALEAADAVLYDRGVPIETLELLPARSFAEPVAGAEAAVARATRLAQDGWRVVRLVAGDPAADADARAAPDRLAGIGIDARVLSGVGAAAHDPSALRSPDAALNGLAG